MALPLAGHGHEGVEAAAGDFSIAAAAHARSTDLAKLADAAWSFGLHRDAAQLYYKRSAGSSYASDHLIRLIAELDPSDKRPAQ
ncbi:hypothetical protein MUK60_00265 [Streptomyces sp. LRE541]|uniref:hypothetical protein n=1 Tax=Streptomyces sp. LRE541 TaxID=2931983 RepID=UPI00200E58BB|nr:hypothetical protein [Streptomyces sp. LRE541]UPZ26389.1 hypothetical protein MUK60_00265 [Streptomyces sp. LRE541]